VQQRNCKIIDLCRLYDVCTNVLVYVYKLDLNATKCKMSVFDKLQKSNLGQDSLVQHSSDDPSDFGQ